ncbi:MAG: tRNA (adenosine(37)-N6)-threonylcarbamoyltransferase complex dimerization subunit type 1 TsaB [Legionella sp.]|nr:MAG: tRNA (adenosine(37)-N6)-threonylcarbamoyltransferase complex dimerization subunit type 1 TsaB [Legionella sp.]
MKLLAIDASTEFSSIALTLGEEVLVEELSSQKTHAQLLLPMIQAICTQAGVEIADLEGIVFGCGPGSFTGLRIACSIAKGLAYPTQIPLYPVSSLTAIASLAREQYPEAPVLAVLDARMQEMYWAYYPPQTQQVDARLNAVKDIEIPQTQEVVLAGVGIDLYWQDFTEQLKSQVTQQLTLYPQAATMIRLVQEGLIKPVTVAEAQPVYVRNQVTQGERGG